jgi:hypothetical protein
MKNNIYYETGCQAIKNKKTPEWSALAHKKSEAIFSR